MGSMIVTNTRMAKEPYEMRESGHRLYSYEELCYYIYARMPLWLLEEERVGMTSWLLGCGVKIGEIDRLSSYDAAVKILSAGTYFRLEEKRQILERMKEYKDMPVSLTAKEKGDLYLSYGKVVDAYFSYEKAIQSENGQEGDDWRNSLYHNMGILCCRLFYWQEAKKWLTKAQEIRERQETKNALLLVSDMEKFHWKREGQPLNPKKLVKKKEEFINEL